MMMMITIILIIMIIIIKIMVVIIVSLRAVKRDSVLTVIFVVKADTRWSCVRVVQWLYLEVLFPDNITGMIAHYVGSDRRFLRIKNTVNLSCVQILAYILCA